LDNAGETLRLQDAVGEKILEFAYDNKWYPATDGLGFSLAIVDEHAAWDSWARQESWRASGTFQGSPGAVDTDADSLPYVWELAAGTNPLVADAEADPDQDGLTNRQEYWAGTDPAVAGSVLRFDAIERVSTNALRLEFSVPPNRSYRVEFADIWAPANWSELATIPIGATNRVIVLPDQLGLTGARYYRLVVPRNP